MIDIKRIELTDAEIALVLKDGSDTQYTIPCPDLITANVWNINKWFKDQIESAYFEYIQNSRPFD